MAITKYKVKVFLAKTKRAFDSFYVDSIRQKPRKRRILGSLFALALIISTSVYGLNLQGKAQVNTKASATDPNAITNNYNFAYDGVSVHVKAVNKSNENFTGTATGRSGDTITFTLTINNPSQSPKNTDVKFTLPAGFTYVAGSASNPNFTSDSVDMVWSGYSAPAGESIITLDTLVP